MEDRFAVLRTAAEVSDLKGLAFEEYLCQLFDDLGYEAEKTQASRDGGADLVLERHGKKIVVQAKSYKKAVGYDAVKEVHAARSLEGADEAWVIATSRFTPDAKQRADELDIRLIGGKGLEALIEKACALRPRTFDPVRRRTFANDGIFGVGSRGRMRAVPSVMGAVSATVRGSRIRMRKLGLWERTQRAVDYSFLLPDCWLNGLNRTERSRRMLLAIASVLMATPKGSMTAEAVRCQMPATVSMDELLYVLRTVPLFKAAPSTAAGHNGATERYALDRDLIMSCYDESYGKLDISMALLIEAIEGLPGSALTVVDGEKMVPRTYAHADQLDDDVLARAVMLGYVVAYAYPDRTVYVPSQNKALLVQQSNGAPPPPALEEVKERTYLAFSEAEQEHAASPSWDIALRYHEHVTALYERFCTDDQGLLGLCYRALYESGGGFTDCELAEYIATIQGIPCTPENVGSLREDCLENDGLIAKVAEPGANGCPPRYFLAFQVGIDGEFLEDHVARSQMLQAQSDFLMANMELLSSAPNDLVAGLAQQHAQLSSILEAKAYVGRDQKRQLQQSISFIEGQLNENQRLDAEMRQRAFAALSEDMGRKQAELQQIVPRCDGDKWRFRLT